MNDKLDELKMMLALLNQGNSGDTFSHQVVEKYALGWNDGRSVEQLDYQAFKIQGTQKYMAPNARDYVYKFRDDSTLYASVGNDQKDVVPLVQAHDVSDPMYVLIKE